MFFRAPDAKHRQPDRGGDQSVVGGAGLFFHLAGPVLGLVLGLEEGLTRLARPGQIASPVENLKAELEFSHVIMARGNDAVLIFIPGGGKLHIQFGIIGRPGHFQLGPAFLHHGPGRLEGAVFLQGPGHSFLLPGRDSPGRGVGQAQLAWKNAERFLKAYLCVFQTAIYFQEPGAGSGQPRFHLPHIRRGPRAAVGFESDHFLDQTVMLHIFFGQGDKLAQAEHVQVRLHGPQADAFGNVELPLPGAHETHFRRVDPAFRAEAVEQKLGQGQALGIAPQPLVAGGVYSRSGPGAGGLVVGLLVAPGGVRPQFGVTAGFGCGHVFLGSQAGCGSGQHGGVCAHGVAHGVGQGHYGFWLGRRFFNRGGGLP